jgi:antirestriction protein ArdC
VVQTVERRAAAGRVTRPPRANGKSYQGIKVLMLWSEALEEKGFAAPIWMTFKQALDLGMRIPMKSDSCSD